MGSQPWNLLRAIYWGMAFGVGYGALTIAAPGNEAEGLAGAIGFLGGAAIGGGLLFAGAAALRNYWLSRSAVLPQGDTAGARANGGPDTGGKPPRVNWRRGLLRLWAAVSALLVLCGGLIGGTAYWVKGAVAGAVASLVLLVLGALGAWVAQGFMSGPRSQ